MVKNPPANVGDTRHESWTPESEKPPGVGNGSLLQYSWLKNSMDRGALWATVHGFAKGGAWLNDSTQNNFKYKAFNVTIIFSCINTYYMWYELNCV